VVYSEKKDGCPETIELAKRSFPSERGRKRLFCSDCLCVLAPSTEGQLWMVGPKNSRVPPEGLWYSTEAPNRRNILPKWRHLFADRRPPRLWGRRVVPTPRIRVSCCEGWHHQGPLRIKNANQSIYYGLRGANHPAETAQRAVHQDGVASTKAHLLKIPGDASSGDGASGFSDHLVLLLPLQHGLAVGQKPLKKGTVDSRRTEGMSRWGTHPAIGYLPKKKSTGTTEAMVLTPELTDLKHELTGRFSREKYGLEKREISVTTRMDPYIVEVLDALVELQIFRSRSEAVSTFVEKTIMPKKGLFDEIRAQASDIMKERGAAQKLALQAIQTDRNSEE
jgi:Arc/MetJ-type ribon-helix-helix transcriptional regulator